MKKLILAWFLAWSTSAWATCSIANIIVTYGGSYEDTTGLNIIITGPGSGGATATPNVVGSGGAFYVSSATVTAAGSFTGTATVTFIGGTSTGALDYEATGYAVMTAGCSGGGSSKKVFSWLL